MNDTTPHAPGDEVGVIRRRELLGGMALAASTGLAGCTAIANWIADRALGDVNLFNETTKPLRGEIRLTGPGGSSVLSSTFDLEAQTEDEPNAEATAMYADVWGDPGEYRVDVQLDQGLDVRGRSGVETAVTIDRPDEQMLGIAFGAPGRDDGIIVAVATEWSGFRDA